MELELTGKKAYTLTSIVFLLIVFITFIASSYRSCNFQLPFINPDHDRPDPEVITCDRSHERYDLCKINGLAVLDPVDATIYTVGPSRPIEKIKPYPRKWEPKLMSKIREVSLKSGPLGPKCSIEHNSPAHVFSIGGLTGNFFHDINDGFLPLYITLTSLSVVDRDIILVVDDAHEWWINKYDELIRSFTKHPIINLANETLTTHCFTRAVVGLISHGDMTMDPNKAQPGPLTMAHFHSFVRNVYRKSNGLENMHQRLKLVWLDRGASDGRVILNQDKAREVAEEVGFDVVVYKPTKRFTLHEAYMLINNGSHAHAMLGVHGSALTHMLLLRPGSVVAQVVPLGLEFVGEVCFGRPAREMGLEYMEYKLGFNESSLSSKYKMEDPVVKEAKVVMDENGMVPELFDVYMIEQNLNLDLVRFRKYIEKVYEKALKNT